MKSLTFKPPKEYSAFYVAVKTYAEAGYGPVQIGNIVGCNEADIRKFGEHMDIQFYPHPVRMGVSPERDFICNVEEMLSHLETDAEKSEFLLDTFRTIFSKDGLYVWMRGSGFTHIQSQILQALYAACPRIVSGEYLAEYSGTTEGSLWVNVSKMRKRMREIKISGKLLTHRPRRLSMDLEMRQHIETISLVNSPE